MWKPFDCDNAAEFAMTFFPEWELYRWQIETLLQLSGYTQGTVDSPRIEPTSDAPLRFTLQAANGSGKDAFVITLAALYCLMCKARFRVIATSSSYNQLDNQTWKYIKLAADRINEQLGPDSEYRLRVTKFLITCKASGSEIILFRSDEEGKTEGFHPFPDPPGAGMMLILNECKSLEDKIVMAIRRCHGYNYWLNVSSPGDPSGFFHRSCTAFDASWPAPLAAGKYYHRKITWRDCPHLAMPAKEFREKEGEAHPIYRSSFEAEFVETHSLALVSQEMLNYTYAFTPNIFGLRAGVDLSLGGDKTVMSVWRHGQFLAEHKFVERDSIFLRGRLINLFEQYQLKAHDIVVDAGGLGDPIIQEIRAAGWNVCGVKNNQKPFNKIYSDRGTEMAFNLRKLFIDKLVDPTPITRLAPDLRRQLTLRKFIYEDGIISLEPKKLFKSRNGYSPDELDAAILANAHCSPILAKKEVPAEVRPGSADLTEFYRNFREVYGHTRQRATADIPTTRRRRSLAGTFGR